MSIRVQLVNEQPLLCIGMREIITSVDDIELAGVASNGQDALEMIFSLHPDVLLLACTLPDYDGVALAKEITRLGQPTSILAYSRSTEDQQVKAMFAAGAMGYTLTTDDSEILLTAIRAVAKGQIWISPKIVQQTFSRIDQELEAAEPLTEREREILRLIGQGYLNREIAEILALEWQTVKNYTSRIYKKLGVVSRSQAILRANRLGLIEI